MKGESTLRILEHIGTTSLAMVDLTAAFLGAGYGASLGKIKREFAGRQKKRSLRHSMKLEEKQLRQRFYTMLCRLKKDDLIRKTIFYNKPFIALTSKGRRHLSVLKKKRENAFPKSTYDQYSAKNKRFTIAAFDIPESERRKRAWLRSALRNLGFQCIQKSVWIGKVKIPEPFLNDLKSLRLVEYIEIFEISKAGSLQQLT